MTTFEFGPVEWLGDGTGQSAELETLARLRITVASQVITANFNKRSGAFSDAINVEMLPLATHLARNWWSILNEPLRSSADIGFQGRHRLDAAMHGFAFPSIAICSAGSDAVLIDWEQEVSEFSPLEFRAARPSDPVQIARDQVEATLMELVGATLERSTSKSSEARSLYDSWAKVRETMNEPDQTAYCVAAGRLGIDPYDPDQIDLATFAETLPPKLFEDITDAVKVEELPNTTQWLQEQSQRLESCPSVEIRSFGEFSKDDISIQPGIIGFIAAKILRQRLGLSERPKKAVTELLGDAVSARCSLSRKGPSAITSLLKNRDGKAFIGAVALSARQQRFRACAATYLAWEDNTRDTRGGTIGLTRLQQASRAFAAEMLAPREILRDRAGPFGFTSEDIENQASDLICPYETVLWQSVRAGIPLRGMTIPVGGATRVFGNDGQASVPNH
jgi:hypothetical protein